jgi:Heparinase II/III-like protein
MVYTPRMIAVLPSSTRRASPLLRRSLAAVLLLASVGLVPACGDEGGDLSPAPTKVTYPRLMARPEHRDLILSRIDREPYATILEQVRTLAAREYQPDEDPMHWDDGANGRNGETAQANAFLAWVFDDAAAADKVRSFFQQLETDWWTNSVSDIDIRMPHPLMGYTNAWDLLMATPYFPASEAEEAKDKITEINRQFYERFLETGIIRNVWLTPAQNNHPIRTACAIGYVAMEFPDDPDAEKWANWAFSELDYLWGPNGQYVQPDGGVSEGPFYFGFAWGVSAAFFIAADNLYETPPTFKRDCINRQTIDPWADNGCVDGEPFTFQNPLRGELFAKSAAWSVALRLPWGSRPPLADAYFNPFNGNALLSSFGQGGMYRWDWESNRDRPYEMGHGADLRAHHLIYFDDGVAAETPPWTTRFLPDAGNAIFRSDWDQDARWLLLLGEHGAVRKTLHDHVDGTSLSLAAYGEYLLVDPGYYKPDGMDNAKTAHSASHNLVLIDGVAAPNKGLLTDFRDADAWIRNTHVGDRIHYAEAHQDYQESTVQRSVVFVDGRYFVVSDALSTTSTVPREHRWRMSGYAGYGSGGTFAPSAQGARWERPLAGIDVFVASTAPGMVVEEPPYEANKSPHVHEFELNREVADHGVIDGVAQAVAPGFLGLLLPYKVGAAVGSEHAPLEASAVDLGPGVAAWTIQTSDGLDLALMREASAPQSFMLPTGSLETDARFVLVRLDGADRFAVVVRGTRLSVDGAALVQAADVSTFAIEESLP